MADRPAYIRGVYHNPAPRERAPLSDDRNPARGIAVGMVVSFPIWCGLAGFAWWAGLVTGCGK